jgi:hypothetical protein
VKTRVIQVVTLTLTSLTALAADAPSPPTASELLAKYTAALDGLRSINLTVEGCENSFNEFKRPVGPTDAYDGSKISGRLMTNYFKFECRSDGKRHAFRIYQWGNVGSATIWTPAEQPAYNSCFWDGHQKYDQNKGINKPGSVGLVTLNNNLPSNNPQVLWHIASYGEMRGYLPPAEQRVDAIARAARSLSVRSGTETMNGSACYVIDAVTEKGKVCLWIDPAHGYMAAKATQNIGPGNVRVAGQRVPAGTTEQRTFEVTRFEQKGDVWVPMEMKATSDMNFANTREFSHATATYKCTEVILNPDHDALHSFDWKFDPELKEGAKFHYSQQMDNYIWQGGKLVPEPIHPRSGMRPRV